jgi:hypothetical protein
MFADEPWSLFLEGGALKVLHLGRLLALALLTNMRLKSAGMKRSLNIR